MKRGSYCLDVRHHWKEIIDLVEKALDAFLPEAGEYPRKINEAMRYSVFAGGKRIRPLLMIEAAALFTDRWQRALPAASALELIHTYSLIHDDLPAMDDDDFRRGKPTAHRKFGEAEAILSGDALLTLAFSLLCDDSLKDAYSETYRQEVPPAVKLRVIAELAGAAGVRGMISGQILDMEAEGRIVEMEMLSEINTRKTGALITAALRCGALLGEAPAKGLQQLSKYSLPLGRGFQIVDDLLDLEGDESKMGKQKGMDKKRNKATIVSLCGAAVAKELRDSLYREAISELVVFGEKAIMLQELTRFIFYRDY